MQATTIDEVIEALDAIIEEAKENNSPAGYFAALYRKVTKSVKIGIANGDFEDGARMEKLDVIFANRYIEAYHQHFSGQKATESWTVAFEQSADYWPIVLQHLLWGINAHINLDLGIAATETSAGVSIEDLKNDFNKINDLLASLVEEVEQELSTIWPRLKALLAFSGKVDDFFVNFSMGLARDDAWQFATELALFTTEKQALMIAERDAEVAKMANYIHPPGIISTFIFGIIRLGEKGDVAHKIAVLE